MLEKIGATSMAVVCLVPAGLAGTMFGYVVGAAVFLGCFMAISFAGAAMTSPAAKPKFKAKLAARSR